jgi:uncharacterized tellurite resistance protein B-like protein
MIIVSLSGDVRHYFLSDLIYIFIEILNICDMNPVENLHFAIGQLAFAVAFSDGKVQKEEREKFQSIVVQELKREDYSFDVTDIVFQIMEKDKMDSNTVYDWAMKEIRSNSHYLSPELKQKFLLVMDRVASAYPPITNDESSIINKFKKDIAGIHGDPVYYNKK